MQPSVREETCGSVETLGVLEHTEGKVHFVAAQLRINALESMFHAEPEVDLLRRGAGFDITAELGDGLNLLDPGVDVCLELVEERGVRKETLRLDSICGYAVAGRMTL